MHATSEPYNPEVKALLNDVRFDTAHWVDSTLASLTPLQRVAQIVMFWTVGYYTATDDMTEVWWDSKAVIIAPNGKQQRGAYQAHTK